MKSMSYFYPTCFISQDLLYVPILSNFFSPNSRTSKSILNDLNLGLKNFFTFLYSNFNFRCVLASLREDVSVRPSIRLSVGNAFVKNVGNRQNFLRYVIEKVASYCSDFKRNDAAVLAQSLEIYSQR